MFLLLFLTRSGRASCLHACLDAVLLVQSSNLLEGADSVGGQLRGEKECPFSGVTNFWQRTFRRVVLESKILGLCVRVY